MRTAAALLAALTVLSIAACNHGPNHAETCSVLEHRLTALSAWPPDTTPPTQLPTTAASDLVKSRGEYVNDPRPDNIKLPQWDRWRAQYVANSLADAGC